MFEHLSAEAAGLRLSSLLDWTRAWCWFLYKATEFKMFALWSKENGGTETHLPSVPLPCCSLLILAEELAKASKSSSTEYAQNMYPVLCNWMNFWSCRLGLLWTFGWSWEGLCHKSVEWARVSSPCINWKCYSAAPFISTDTAAEFS